MADEDGRDQPESTPARELRIERIAELMRACKWRTGVTGRELAKELGLAYQTIRLDAAIASRRVYAEVMQDREAIGAKVGAALEKALDGAIDEGDWKAVASLSKVYADASGVSAPQRHEVTSVSLDEIDQLRSAAKANACSPQSEEPKTTERNEPGS